VIAEDGNHEIADTRPVSNGGDGLDAIWADDFHHEIRVALTNAHENYYAHYDGSTASIAGAVNSGLMLTERQAGATPIDERDPASAFVFCIQNHDQVGNRPFGDRLHHDISLDRYAVASTVLLTCPETPLFFMGQEFAASTPFLYFTDHPEELGRLVTEGRRKEFSGFPAFQDAHLRETIPDPQAESTFLTSKLNLHERSLNSVVQTGPKIAEGGSNDGLLSVGYQLLTLEDVTVPPMLAAIAGRRSERSSPGAPSLISFMSVSTCCMCVLLMKAFNPATPIAQVAGQWYPHPLITT